MSYNGWSNRETWLVNVWFDPVYKADLDMIKEMIDEALTMVENSDYRWLCDFISTSEIDWDELAEQLSDGDECEDDE